VIIFSRGLFIATKKNIKKGNYTITFEIPPYTLNEDTYYFEMFWGLDRSEIAFQFEDFGFEVLNIENSVGEIIKSPGILFPNINYEILD
jgi:lipopolysaccharide transport system ATP-binding protein